MKKRMHCVAGLSTSRPAAWLPLWKKYPRGCTELLSSVSQTYGFGEYIPFFPINARDSTLNSTVYIHEFQCVYLEIQIHMQFPFLNTHLQTNIEHFQLDARDR